MSRLEGALCRGKWWLFDSPDLVDHHEARVLCAECPALAACAELLRQVKKDSAGLRQCGGGPAGTWAGELVGSRAKPREHGSERGWGQHRYNGEKVCDPCRLAHNAHIRATSQKAATA